MEVENGEKKPSKCKAAMRVFALVTVICFIGTWYHLSSVSSTTSVLSQEVVQMNETIQKLDWRNNVNNWYIERLEKNLENLNNEKLREMEENIQKTNFHVKAASAQSCTELKRHGYSKDGYYFIDPDGRYQGQSSFEVYCRFTDPGPRLLFSDPAPIQTRIEMKSKNIIEFSTENPNDNYYEFEYKASQDQMQALIKNSGNCKQNIEVRCKSLPLHKNGENLAYWYGTWYQEFSFFDSSNIFEQNCKCNRFSLLNCGKNTNATCECDLNYDHEVKEFGSITAEMLLPIQRFGYRFKDSMENGSLVVQIGDLICEENFRMELEGEVDYDIEKTYWEQWNEEFGVRFDIEIKSNQTFYDGTNDPYCMPILKMLDDTTKPQRTFANITYCSHPHRLIFKIDTNSGYLSKTLNLTNLDVKEHIEWKNGVKRIKSERFENYESKLYHFDYDSMPTLERTKFLVFIPKRSGYHNKNLKISNLVIDKNRRPTVFFG